MPRTVLILEGNSDDLLAAGRSASVSFVRTFLAIAPTTQLRIAAPYSESLDADVFDGIDGVIFTGSATPWAVDAPDAEPQRCVMENAFAAGLPVWGSCNGMQLAAVVLGGEVGENDLGVEVGVAEKVVMTQAGESHPMMRDRNPIFTAPTAHRDIVTTLPDHAVVTAQNAHSPIQGFSYDRDGIDFWGTQYHPELNLADVADYIRSPGIFHHKMDLVDDLERAEADAAAAARLETTPEDLQVAQRACELRNWLAHLPKRSD